MGNHSLEFCIYLFFVAKKYEKTRSRQHTGEIKDSHIKLDKYNFSFSVFLFIYREVCVFQRKFAYVQPVGTQLLL